MQFSAFDNFDPAEECILIYLAIKTPSCQRLMRIQKGPRCSHLSPQV